MPLQTSVENEPLKLLPHNLREAQGRYFIVKPDGTTVGLPSRFREFFFLSRDGASIAKLLGLMRKTQGTERFALLSKYIEFLYDHDLLAERRAVKLAETLKPDYIWPYSVAFEPIAEFKIYKSESVKSQPIWFWSTQAIFLLVCLLSTASIYLSLTGEPKSTEVTSWWPVLFSFWAVFALGRSFLAITQNGLMHFAKGTGVQLNVSIDAVSFALSSDSFSTVRATGALLAAGAFLPLSPLLPAGLAAWFGGIPGAGVFSGLLFFSVSSPFVHSVATEWLRSYYSYYLQSKRTNIDLSVERETHAIHLAAGVVWTFSFLIFIGFFYFPFIKGIALGLEWRSMSTLASAGLFFLIQLVVLFSLVADVLARRGNKLGALQVRTLWRRRYSEALAADAVRERRKPTQSELQDLPLLRTVPLYIGQRIIENSQVADVETGVAVCRQGNRDRILFVVLTGSFAVTRLSGSRSGTGPIRKKVVAVLEAGAVFGESAFFFDHPRSADVVALENSTVLAIRHDESMKTLSDKHSDELQLRIWFFQVLAANPDWRQLPSEALDALVRAGTGATFSAGEKVIREGEEGQDCYFIVQGNATVVQNLKPINNMKAGDVIGEIALLWPGTLRTATVIADTDLLTVRLNSDRLWRLLESHLPLAVEIEKIGEARIAADQLRKKP